MIWVIFTGRRGIGVMGCWGGSVKDIEGDLELCGIGKTPDERKSTALKSLIDRPLPKLALTTVEGRPYDSSGLRGKVLLLNFFASW